MRIHREDGTVEPISRRTAVSIGAYDGVHRGHQLLLQQLRAMATVQDLDTVVVTFDQHPARVVRPESAPLLLTDLDQKLELLASTGVDHTLVLKFDAVRAQESASDFVTEVLVERLGAKLVVVGEDFHFGHQRQGNVALLDEMGARYGFEVLGKGLMDMAGNRARDHEQVSSTAIRRALAHGELEAANAMLTRPYEVRGVVSRGDQRGRTIGFPTANVTVPPSILLPADAVYAGWYERADGTIYPTAISVGTRPTFYDTHGALLVEAHLMDFDGDLYDEPAKVRFVQQIRLNRKMSGLDELKAQLQLDVAQCRTILGG